MNKLMKNLKSDEEGFILLEVIVAMVLLAVVGTFSVYFLATSVQTVSANESRNNATQYVRDYVETVKAVEYKKIGFFPSAYVPSTIQRDGVFYETVKRTGTPAADSGLYPRTTETVDSYQYTIYTYIYWTDGTAPTDSKKYEQKTVEIEVWLDNSKVASAQITLTPSPAEIPVNGATLIPTP